jgi:hypothetical protein
LRYVGYLDGRGAVGNTGAYDFYGVRPWYARLLDWCFDVNLFFCISKIYVTKRSC